MLEISGIGINLPPDIMAYSILGKISRDCTTYNHIIDSMVISMDASINPQKVLDKLSDLLRHEHKKKDFKKQIKTEYNTNSEDFLFKIQYVSKNRKHNPKNTTHTTEKCWALHPELRPPPQNKPRKGGEEAESHQTGMEALLTDASIIKDIGNILVIDCGTTHHMFNDESIFTKFMPENQIIRTRNPTSHLVLKGQGTMKIIINNKEFTLENCLYVPNISKNLVCLLDLCTTPITITRQEDKFILTKENKTLMTGDLIN
ncbi:hypothetical protein O181_029179 [Austropuccinia psidii MF-1]|uniref:Retrovirus-related Pol polyprotein from transposon TNT 1-94-like beta-barrel domain-containing protein n=1 Tax=Austropuccinia psidii MF-1 TaxID=1389203 RepID=A0A9Q3CQE7_9BASI|nr:hypothetical protein [Austropuccinia psidii MF-1]